MKHNIYYTNLIGDSYIANTQFKIYETEAIGISIEEYLDSLLLNNMIRVDRVTLNNSEFFRVTYLEYKAFRLFSEDKEALCRELKKMKIEAL